MWITAIARIAIAFAAVASHGVALAQVGSFPDRLIKFIVPYGPGGTVDPTARTLAMRAAEILGQAVVVENKPGAAGSIGTDFVVRAPADGYSVLIHTNVVTSEPWLKPTLSYNFLKDMTRSDDRRDAVRRARAPVAAGQLGEGAGRLREGASGQAQLRGVGHRVVGASARRAVPARNRHQAGLHSLRGWRCTLRGLLSNEIQVAFDTLPGSIGT